MQLGLLKTTVYLLEPAHVRSMASATDCRPTPESPEVYEQHLGICKIPFPTKKGADPSA